MMPTILDNDNKKKFYGGNMRYVCTCCGLIIEEKDATVNPDGEIECPDCIKTNLIENNAWDFERYEPEKKPFKLFKRDEP